MNQHEDNTVVRAGTVIAPTFYEGHEHSEGDFRMHLRNYTYMTDQGPVTGIVGSVMFTIDRPAKVVWPYLSDFNQWEGPLGINYSGGPLGDQYANEEHGLGEERVRISFEAMGDMVLERVVLRVIPEHLLILHAPIPADGSSGGISPGFDVFTLNEYDGKTTVTGHMEHASRSTDETEAEALERSDWSPPQYDMVASVERWKGMFVPTLKALVYESS